MRYRQVRTGNGTPMHAAPWNLPNAYDALELQSNVLMNSLKPVNFSTLRLVWRRSFTG